MLRFICVVVTRTMVVGFRALEFEEREKKWRKRQPNKHKNWKRAIKSLQIDWIYKLKVFPPRSVFFFFSFRVSQDAAQSFSPRAKLLSWHTQIWMLRKVLRRRRKTFRSLFSTLSRCWLKFLFCQLLCCGSWKKVRRNYANQYRTKLFVFCGFGGLASKAREEKRKKVHRVIESSSSLGVVGIHFELILGWMKP